MDKFAFSVYINVYIFMKNTLKDLDGFFRSLLDLDSFLKIDDSLNGIQIGNDGSEIKKIAFAVDAGMEVFKRARDMGAGLLFVHHGLFWGNPLRLEGYNRERVKFLLDNNIALYGVHLPLDHHPKLGNNGVMAELLGIVDPEPFGVYHGMKIGLKGSLKTPLGIDDAVKKISFMNRPPLGVYPFGKKENHSCAVVSGGAAFNAFDAITEGIDLYISGEASHTLYHHALECGLNIIAGGHYSTEVWGVRRMMEECVNELKIDSEFIDVPTGL